ncbi:MAG: polysaccharide biosynthesis protein [Clostridia bacterium]|nr:polysaccharide biosynthesis protein [Clostridia bacterium]
MKNKGIIKGAILLSLGGIITKLLGAVYRIPLTNLLGAEGIGLYQMVFPLYSALLTFSSTGAPGGISKLIAEGNNAKITLKSSLKVFASIGLALSLFMAVFSNQIATLQGNASAGVCYSLLSPSVFLVSVISCFRGYYQGFSDMKPTAVSQICEQGVKLTVGLLLCFAFRGNAVLSASLAVLAVTISEGITLIYFMVKAKAVRLLLDVKVQTSDLRPIFKTVIPMMAVTLIIPIVRTVDSFLIINLLKTYLSNATELYGLLTGAVESLISMPISVCYALAITSIPVISRLKKKGGDYLSKCYNSILLTFLLSMAFGAIVYLFSPFAVDVLYGGLSEQNKWAIVDMLKVSSISVVTLSLMQTTVACVNSLGKFKVTVTSGVIAGAIKIVLSVILLKNPKINIFGAIYSDIFCYFVASFLNLSYIIYSDFKKRVYYARNNGYRIRG